MRVIVVGNVKGGVGKSTTAVQLALYGALRFGMRVLLVDADPGRSALSWATRAGDAWPQSVATIGFDGQVRLRRWLFRMIDGFDLVVIDTPHSPTEGAEVAPVLAEAMAAADHLIVPSQPLWADLDRLGDLRAGVEVVTGLRPLTWHVLFTRVNLSRPRHVREMREMLEAAGVPVLVPVVRQAKDVDSAFGTANLCRQYAGVADHVLGWAAHELTSSPTGEVTGS